MTGFGKAIKQLPGKNITVEIKSLNSKTLDLNMRMPYSYKEKELVLRKKISDALERGKVDFSLHIEQTGEDTSSKINVPVVEGYIQQLSSVVNGDRTELLKMAVRMPDALKTEKEEIDEEEFRHLTEATEEALKALNKYRLDEALDVLNHRHDAYAYLLATQPALHVSDAVPDLKVKFFLHALYADAIPLILEHNTGGAVAEFGRIERPTLLERTYLFPRALEEHYNDESVLTTRDSARARAIELAYHASNLDERLAVLAERARDNGLDVSTQELESYLDSELNGHTPSYSGVITDSLTHLEALDQCFSWTTTEELEDQLSHVP
jgi:hypothetical protein